MIIYQALNKANGKKYIGQTIGTLENRRIGHYYDANRGSRQLFHQAIRKYSEENWEWSVVCECYSQEDLDEKEQHYIEHFKTKVPHGYNSNHGGTLLHLEGKKFGEWEVLSFSHWDSIPHWKSNERLSFWNCRCSCGHEEVIMGIKLSGGATRRCSDCWERLLKSEEWAEASRQRSNEIFARPEMKNKMKAAMKEVANRPEVKQKQIERQTGSKLSESHKEAIRQGVLRHQASKEGKQSKAKQIERQRGSKLSEARKEAIRQGVLRHHASRKEKVE